MLFLPMGWRPLLSGELAAQAELSAEEIAAGLTRHIPLLKDSSLSSGNAGISLFQGYYSLIRADTDSAAAAEETLSRAVDTAGLPGKASLSLFSGMTGLAWALHHLQQILHDNSDIEMTRELDDALLEALETERWRWEFDLVYGLSGIAVYALDHPDLALGNDLLRRVVQHLDALALDHSGSLAWLTPPALLEAPARARFPEGCYDLGLAHGVAGVLGVLARACELGRLDGEHHSLLSGAVAGLLNNKRPDDGGSSFGAFVTEGPAPPCRSAWCYGDPGVAAALYRAGLASGRDDWQSEAIAIAHKDARRSPGEAGVIDAGICHGSAGLGHLYNRLYQATGEAGFGETARLWFERTLKEYRIGGGIAGYGSWWSETNQWHPSPGFLDGAAGIGLALLASVSAIEPRWDRMLLLDLPATAAN